jgi:hypothetical protein
MREVARRLIALGRIAETSLLWNPAARKLSSAFSNDVRSG